jgi:predicted DNA-binding transcriptional regulator
MKQKKAVINLFDIIKDDSPYGNDQGQATHSKLKKEINKFPGVKILGISLKGIKRTDASFPRESVVALAKEKRGEIGFYLKDFASDDMIDNWSYGASAKDQPLIVYLGKEFKVIGPSLSADMLKILTYIIKSETVTTSKVAEKFDLSAPNASMKLKKLFNQGLVVGSKEVAESGGIEYVYGALK